MARARAGVEKAHRGLFENVTFETFRVAMACPAFDAEKGRAGFRPERHVRKILDRDLDRRAAPIGISHIRAGRVEKAERVIGEQLGREPQHAAFERQRAGAP